VDVVPFDIKKICCAITRNKAAANSSAKIAPTKHKAILKLIKNCLKLKLRIKIMNSLSFMKNLPTIIRQQHIDTENSKYGKRMANAGQCQIGE
jgi:hypothetical protein